MFEIRFVYTSRRVQRTEGRILSVVQYLHSVKEESSVVAVWFHISFTWSALGPGSPFSLASTACHSPASLLHLQNRSRDSGGGANMPEF